MGNRLEKDEFIGILVAVLPKNNKAHANIMRTLKTVYRTWTTTLLYIYIYIYSSVQCFEKIFTNIDSDFIIF